MAARPGLTETAGGERYPSPGAAEFVSLPLSVIAGGQRRLDGEAYLTGGFAARERIEAALPFQRLSELAKVWQPGRLKGIQVGPEHGVPFLAATQVFDIKPTPRKWIAAQRTPDLDGRFVDTGWILVTCSGNVGDSIVSYAALSGVVVSHDLLRIRTREPRLRGYIYAFLRTRLGLSMLRSAHYGSIVKHLEPEHLMDIPVPAVSDALCREVESRVSRVVALRDEAFELMNQAESRFQDEMGQLDVPDEWFYSISASAIVGGRRRLDGEYYSPASAVVQQALGAGGRTVAKLGDLARVLLPNRFKRVYVEGGIPYLDSEDIFKLNPRLAKFMPVAAKKNLADYFVQRDWLLVSRSGQTYGLIGSVMLADRWHEGMIVSEDILRIIPKPGVVRSGYLQVAMGHPVYGRTLMRRLAFGSQVPHIAQDDLRGFPVVRLGDKSEAAIADMVERASHLRGEADDEENRAVKILEEELARQLS